MRRLRFRHDFRVEALRGEGVLLLSDREHFYLKGHTFELLAPLLNGKYNEEEIVDRLESKTTLSDLYYALETLKKRHYVVEVDPLLPESLAAFLNSIEIFDTRSARQKLKKTGVYVHTFGGVSDKEILSALRSFGIKTRRDGFPVVLTDDYLRPALKEWNNRMLRKKLAWMIVKPVGTAIWLGPIFVPLKTGCWQCLAHRLSSNQEVETFVQRRKRRFHPASKVSLVSTRKVAANLAATEVIRWLVEEKNERIEGKVATVDFTTLDLRHHTLIRRPRCSACGDPSLRNKKSTPIHLQSSPISPTANGLHRSLSAGQTVRMLEHHVSPITGAVTQLVRVTPDHSPLHVYFAGHNNAMKTRNVYMLRHSLRSKSSGKGKTDTQSRASALCEAIERCSGNFSGDVVRILAKKADLGGSAIHPNDLMLYSTRQYKNRKEWNAKAGAIQFVPEPFHADRTIEWTPVWSLTDSRIRYVPTSYCYYGYNQRWEDTFCLADSNGNASGNTIEEAILHGFLELIERDSVAIWWYNRLMRPGVDLASFNEPYYDELIEFYASRNREFWVLDLTTDFSIPSFAAITRRTDGAAEEIAFGFGAHFDAKLAVLRAVTEMGQLLPHFEPPAENQTDCDFDDPDAIAWWRNATLQSQPYLVPDSTSKTMKYSHYPKYETVDLRDDVLRCVEVARNHGMETLVLDQTKPEIGMPVVKVMVPGLRHFWARFAPGRLYDVPVRQGWLKKPNRESELNPIPMFV